MRIVAISYRDWALEIYDRLARNTHHAVLIIRKREQYDEDAVIAFNPDLILFYGWSWIVSDALLEQFTCLMLHPSPLPKYRGGSPIQNQIIRGETESAVTIFKMSAELDAGDIVRQKPISFEGRMSDIFARLTETGYQLTLDLIDHGCTFTPQDHSLATSYKRRKPSDSEITIRDLQEEPGDYLYNKIRMLEDPYPNAFIRTCDGRRLLIKQAELK